MIKLIHVSCVVLTFTLFLVRGVWMITGSARLQQRWVKVVPHVVDTLLLGSAIVLTMQIHQYPFVQDWLTTKVFGLLAYIGLGMVALRYGKTRRVRIGAWLAALAVFIYIVSVASTRTPIPTAFWAISA